VADLSGVGSNWSDHIYTMAIHLYSDMFNYLSFPPNPENLATQQLRYQESKTGLFSKILCDTVGFFNSGDDRLRTDGGQDFQLTIFPFLEEMGLNALTPAGFVPGSPILPKPDVGKAGVTLCVSVAQPKSRGGISLVSVDPFVAPKIDPRYYSAKEDLDSMKKGLLFLQNLMRKFGDVRFEYDFLDFDDEALEKFIFQTSFHGWHGCGTCKMGDLNDSTAVVDSQLRIRGLKNIRVIDCSIMPVCTAGNINSPTVMIAEKGSDLIKNSHPDIFIVSNK